MSKRLLRSLPNLDFVPQCPVGLDQLGSPPLDSIFQGGIRLLELAGHDIERPGEHADLVPRVDQAAFAEVPAGDPIRESDQFHEWTSNAESKHVGQDHARGQGPRRQTKQHQAQTAQRLNRLLNVHRCHQHPVLIVDRPTRCHHLVAVPIVRSPVLEDAANTAGQQRPARRPAIRQLPIFVGIHQLQHPVHLASHDHFAGSSHQGKARAECQHRCTIQLDHDHEQPTTLGHEGRRDDRPIGGLELRRKPDREARFARGVFRQLGHRFVQHGRAARKTVNPSPFTK